MRALLVLAVAAAAAAPGCLGPLRDEAPTRDGIANVLVINRGPTASAALRDATGATVWDARLLAEEGQAVDLAVDVEGCADYTLFAGYNGSEPDVRVLFVAPCDYDLEPVRAEFRPPAWYRPPGERGEGTRRAAFKPPPSVALP